MMGSDTLFCFGVENEHAPATLLPDGRPQTTDNHVVYQTVKKELLASGVPYLFGGNGLFTGYGRFYLETTGNHVEVGIAPGTSPDEAVEREVKFTALLKQALRRAHRSRPGLTLLKNNRDYVSNSTWGSHESYATRTPFEVIEKALIPFLVTRQVFAGSGTLQGQSFWLSPRAVFMALPSGGSTTRDRAIYSTARNEPLMKCPCFSRRLHLIVGDSLMSQFGQWLKLGTTALVVRAAEENPRLGDGVAFSKPVESIKALSRVNPKSRSLFDRRLLTVQKHYLQMVEALLQRREFPAWCGKVWQAWAGVLEVLESDPMALDTQLDAYIKLRLFNQFLERRGKQWADLQSDENLRWEMALVDVRYHALAGGIFEMLEAEGALNHAILSESDSVPGSEQDPYVVTSPPREAFRSRIIKQFSGDRRLRCDWTRVINAESGSHLFMPDPFSDAYEWKEMKGRDADHLKAYLAFADGDLPAFMRPGSWL